MNLLTIIVILIFALFILRGYRRGFVKSLASMASLILSIILVNFATPYVSEFLKEQTPVYDYILEACEKNFSVSAGSGEQGEKKESASFEILEEEGQSASEEKETKDTGKESAQDAVIDSLKLPGVISDLLKENNTPEIYLQIAAQSFADYVPKYIANLILSILSFVATWILVISFIWLAVMTLDIITALPIIHGLNQILGLAMGFVQGLIIVWILFLIITIFSQTDAGRQLMRMITESPILTGIYDTNILLDFLQNTLPKLF